MVNRSGIIAATRGCVVSLATLLGACSGHGPAEGPIDWWHQLEGGLIARDRPPPPGEFDPYPKVGTVPPRPDIPSVASRQALYDQLVAQRERTERIAARDPVPPPAVAAPAKAQTAPAPAAPATAPPATAPLTTADAGAANASFAGAEPAAKPAPPAGPPRTVVAPSVVTQGLDGEPIALPPVYDAPPAPARFEGVAALPAPSPEPPVPAFIPTAQRGTPVDFLPGKPDLASTAAGILHAFAVKRGGASVAVTGYGDASSDAPEDQAASLRLALSRAKAVAARLQVEGVPASSVRIGAEAFGRGAAVRLIQ